MIGLRWKLLAAAVAGAVGGLGIAGNASATEILAMGQVSTSNTLTAMTNAGDTQTTITGTSVAVSITEILAGVTTPLSAYLDLSATSTAAALPGAVDQQAFSGTFAITSGTGGSGTNYLSGTFTDAVFGFDGSTGLTLSAGDPPDTVTFTSGSIADLYPPSSVDFAFSDVTPAVSIVGSTLGGFTASFTATFDASAVPEPSALAVLGVGLLGLASLTMGVSPRRRG